MKLWKKVYVYSLIIITLGVNLGFSGILYFSYNQMLQEEKNRCMAEYVVLQQNLSRDIAQMEKTFLLNTEYFTRYVEVYNSYFEPDTRLYGIVDNVTITEYENDRVYLPEENGLTIEKEQGTTIYISQALDENHANYRVVMVRKLESFDKTWSTLQPLYFFGGIVLSLGVSIFLGLTVRVLLKPLDILGKTAKEVEKENWSARVCIKGNNELADLGRQFNAMARSVEENISKLEEQSQQKQELIHNLAHEMNTPITSIQGFADYMRISQITREEQEECLNFIIGESKRLKEISSTLLSMAWMQNTEEVMVKNFSLNPLCNRIKRLFENRFIQEDIEFLIDCQVDKMLGDEVLIESLLRNLITNAHHAVVGKENAKIAVTISQEENQLIIQVTDNGCGMKKEHIEQIFEPFYRVDKARSREKGGSGLGLPFCKKIVNLHKGQIAVDSKENKGTTFTATFTIS